VSTGFSVDEEGVGTGAVGPASGSGNGNGIGTTDDDAAFVTVTCTGLGSSAGEEPNIEDMNRPPKNPPLAVAIALSAEGEGKDIISEMIIICYSGIL